MRFRRYFAALFVALAPFAFQKAAAADGTVAADNLSFEIGASHYLIQHLALSGTKLTQAEIAGLFAGKGAPGAGLARLSAAIITIPKLTVTTTTPTQIEIDTYRDITFTNVARGHAEKFTIGGLSSTAKGATDGATIESAYGPSEFDGFDLALALRALAAPQSGEPTPLCDRFTIEGGKVIAAQAHVAFGFGTLSARNVKTRALRIPHAATGMLFTQDDAADAPLAAYAAGLLRNFESGNFELADLRFESTDAAPIRIRVGHVQFSKTKADRIDAIADQAIAISGRGWTARIAELSGHNLNLGAADPDQKKADATPPAHSFPVSELNASGIDADFTDTRPGADASDRLHFQISQLSSTVGPAAGGTRFTGALDHLTLDLNPLKNGALGPLATLGYDKLDLSGRIDTHYDPAARTLDVAALSLNGAGMGQAHISGKFSGVTQQFLSTDPAAATRAALGIRLNRCELHFVNDGLFERVLAAAAKRAQMTPAQMRQKYLAQTHATVAAFLDDEAEGKALDAALAKFIAAPKNLRISVAAPDGFGLSDFLLLSDPQALAHKLSITAAANQ